MTTAALYTLYAFLAAGAAGLYLCLPSTRADAQASRRAGGILAAAALAALAVFWARWIGSDFEGRTFFVIFAVIAVVGAVRVVTSTRPVYSALYFVLVVLAVTGLCVLAAAEFLAAALVIVYGGAILVTYVFVIMLAQQSGTSPYDRSSREPIAAVTLGFAVVAAATQAMLATDPIAAHVPRTEARPLRLITEADPQAGPADAGTKMKGETDADDNDKGNVRAVGEKLTTTYIMAIEIGGVLLLVAMVGAVAIARKRIEPEALTPREQAALRAEQEDPRRRGREAEPF